MRTVRRLDGPIGRGPADRTWCSWQDALEFQAVHWESHDEGEEPPERHPQTKNRNWRDKRSHTAYITGVTADGATVSVRTPYKPYFLLRIRDSLDPERTLSSREIERAVSLVTEKRENGRNRCFQIKTPQRGTKLFVPFSSVYEGYRERLLKDLDAGFTGPEPKRFQYVELHWRTLLGAKRAASALQNPNSGLSKDLKALNLTVKVYEADVPPVVRIMHLTGVEAAGWVRVPPSQYKWVDVGVARAARTQLDAVCPDWRSLAPVEGAGERIAPIREASLDLETYSADDGRLSAPERPSDEIIQCAITLTDFGSQVTPHSFVFHNGVCEPIDDPNVTLEVCEDERELLLAVGRFMARADPESLHAYNGWFFDFPYLAVRARHAQCWKEFSALCSRFPWRPAELVEKALKSNAYGDNTWRHLAMPGRVVWDSRDYLVRAHRDLRSPALAYVSEHFLAQELPPDALGVTLGSSVVRIKHPNHGLEEGAVIHFSDIATPSLEQDAQGKLYYALYGWSYEDLHGSMADKSSGLHRIHRVLSPDEYEVKMRRPARTPAGNEHQTGDLVWCGGRSIKVFETKHDVDFSDMNRAFKAHNGRLLSTVARYCVQDTLLPQKILDKLCVLPNLIEMAKVTWVPLEFLLMRGQQIKAYSQLVRAAHQDQWAVPTAVKRRKKEALARDGEDEDEEDDGVRYTGGAVLEPMVGFYDEPIAVPDFASLYPTTMIDGDFCYSTLVKDERYLNMPGVSYNRVTMDDGRVHTFALSYEGLVPRVLAELLRSRGRRKKLMAASKTSLEYKIHNGAQLALKVSANSIYGFTGVSPGKALLPCMAIAESTTKCGREATYAARDYVENVDNFRDVMQCTTHFPLDYVYLMRNVKKGACFHMTANKLLGAAKLNATALEEQKSVDCGLDGLHVWTDEGWEEITGFDARREPFYDGLLVRVRSPRGKTLDMSRYTCSVRYGDTDSIFVLHDSTHLPTETQRVAYCGIVAAFAAGRVTRMLRARCTWYPPERQWMELEYEKTYRRWLLFSKKRYVGLMTEFDPTRFKPDNKGVAAKRKDFCTFVKESYTKILAELFAEGDVSRETLLQNAMRVVRRAVDDLLNNRVPLAKLVVAKQLSGQYKLAKREHRKLTKRAQHNDFSPKNIFEGYEVVWRATSGVVYRGKVTRKEPPSPWAKRPPLSATIDAVERTPSGSEDAVVAPGLTLDLDYGQIEARGALMMSLERILDPNTPESALERCTAAHARLARRLYARDPASAPPSGTRVPFVFCEIGDPSAPQHARAEDPSYAVRNGLRLDALYYLNRQCANAWGQILDTAFPGTAERIYEDARTRYSQRTHKQTLLTTFGAKSAQNDALLRTPKRVAPRRRPRGPLPGQTRLGAFFAPLSKRPRGQEGD